MVTPLETSERISEADYQENTLTKENGKLEPYANRESFYMETDQRQSKLSTVFNSKDPIVINKLVTKESQPFLNNTYSGEFDTQEQESTARYGDHHFLRDESEAKLETPDDNVDFNDVKMASG